MFAEVRRAHCETRSVGDGGVATVSEQGAALRGAMPGQASRHEHTGHEKVRKVRGRVRGVLPKGVGCDETKADEETVRVLRG